MDTLTAPLTVVAGTGKAHCAHGGGTHRFCWYGVVPTDPDRSATLSGRVLGWKAPGATERPEQNARLIDSLASAR